MFASNFSVQATGVFIGVLLSSISPSLAQTVFQKTYGGGGDQLGLSVEKTSDSGYIIVGLTDSFGAGAGDVYLIKTNSLGDTLWTRSYGGASTDYGISVQQTSDSGYVITGYTYSFGAGSLDVYLIKTNSLGDTLWTRTYGGASGDDGYSVQQTSDGGYIITGYTSSFGAGSRDVYLIKTNSLGDTLWTRTYGGASNDAGNSVQQTSEGGYIIAGFTSSFGAGGGDVYLIKTNSIGDTLWTRTYGGANNDAGRSVQQTSEGGYIIAGFTSSFGAGGGDVYLIKTNSLGDMLWTRRYGGASDDAGNSVQQTSDGGYLIAGYTSSFGSGRYDVYLIRTNSLGDTLWTRRYGGPSDDYGNSVQQTSDGGYVIAGYTNSFGAGDDVYLIKTDRDGVVTVVAINNLRGIPREFILKQNYPNPFNPSTTINYELPVESWVSLKVYDLYGQEVATLLNGESLAGRHEVSWNATALPSGVYLCRLRAGTFTDTKRLLLVR
jgi:type IX secretion system substrate protein